MTRRKLERTSKCAGQHAHARLSARFYRSSRCNDGVRRFIARTMTSPLRYDPDTSIFGRGVRPEASSDARVKRKLKVTTVTSAGHPSLERGVSGSQAIRPCALRFSSFPIPTFTLHVPPLPLTHSSTLN
jgi:hypothetical protein